MAREKDGHQPRKRFGQNFLADQRVIEQLVQLIRPSADQHLVEIGPGLGALTRPLIQSGARLTLVELDRDLVDRLQNQYGNNPRVTIIGADALKTDFTAIAQSSKLRIVGNLPYNISTPLLFHLMEHRDVIHDMYFMLQREVVDRITASSGSGHWGRLGIMLQYHCVTEKLLEVEPLAFDPPPKVWSAVVHLCPRQPKPVAQNPEQLEHLVRIAFTQRRKTLRNAVKSLISAEQLQDLGIDPQDRPEQLNLEEFVRIANQIESQ